MKLYLQVKIMTIPLANSTNLFKTKQFLMQQCVSHNSILPFHHLALMSLKFIKDHLGKKLKEA